MKNNMRSSEMLHPNIIRKSGYSRKQPPLQDSGLLAGVKEEYQFPGFDTMLADLLQNEEDYGIYRKVKK